MDFTIPPHFLIPQSYATQHPRRHVQALGRIHAQFVILGLTNDYVKEMLVAVAKPGCVDPVAMLRQLERNTVLEDLYGHDLRGGGGASSGLWFDRVAGCGRNGEQD